MIRGVISLSLVLTAISSPDAVFAQTRNPPRPPAGVVGGKPCQTNDDCLNAALGLVDAEVQKCLAANDQDYNAWVDAMSKNPDGDYEAWGHRVWVDEPQKCFADQQKGLDAAYAQWNSSVVPDDSTVPGDSGTTPTSDSGATPTGDETMCASGGTESASTDATQPSSSLTGAFEDDGSNLFFDGHFLYVVQDSRAVATFPATSGKDGVKDTRIRNRGPLPEGEYYIDPSEISQGGFLRNLLGDWGNFRVALHPTPETDTNDINGKPRTGFFLHGGKSPGSAGCIDVANSDTEVMNLLRQFDRTVILQVKY